jgi:hypothetical protein
LLVLAVPVAAAQDHPTAVHRLAALARLTPVAVVAVVRTSLVPSAAALAVQAL